MMTKEQYIKDIEELEQYLMEKALRISAGNSGDRRYIEVFEADITLQKLHQLKERQK